MVLTPFLKNIFRFNSLQKLTHKKINTQIHINNLQHILLLQHILFQAIAKVLSFGTLMITNSNIRGVNERYFLQFVILLLVSAYEFGQLIAIVIFNT